MKEFDKNRLDKYELSEIDRENMEKNKVLLTQAKKLIEEDHDTVKEMNKMILYYCVILYTFNRLVPWTGEPS